MSVTTEKHADGGDGPEAPRCGARRRDGGCCTAPPEPGKRRCRNHGGAPGTGAPKGNRNAFKHGVYSAEELARRKAIMDFARLCRGTLAEIDEAARVARLQRRLLKRGSNEDRTVDGR